MQEQIRAGAATAGDCLTGLADPTHTATLLRVLADAAVNLGYAPFIRESCATLVLSERFKDMRGHSLKKLALDGPTPELRRQALDLFLNESERLHGLVLELFERLEVYRPRA